MAPIVDVPEGAQQAFFRSTFVTLRDPLARPPFFLGLELAMYACAALTLVHAVRARRGGDSGAALVWASTFAYGILIEIASYNFVDNFTHGPFTVMFYRDRLPLYVSVLYPVFIYTAAITVRRFGLGRLAEPFAVGLAIVAIDFPFDISGPIARWWAWSDGDPNIAYRWHGVPVTSYYWHLAFGGILVALCRGLAGFVSRRRRPLAASLALAFPIGAGTMVLGFLAFLPFHLLKAIGVRDGLVVGALLALSGLVAVVARRTPGAARERGLPAVFGIWYGYHAIVAVVLASRGALDAGRLVAILIAVGVGAALHLAARRVGSAPSAPAPAGE